MNVIFIMNDSFRRDHLGAYGGVIRTPNLDGLAAESAVFDRCYIGSYPTVPNRWDLCTGRFGFPVRGWQPLAAEDEPWAEILSGRGIHTQIIWDTPMLGAGSYNYTRGFDGVYFVHGQKGDPWITSPSLDIRLPAQPHKILSIPSLETYLRNHADRRYEREYCVGRTVSTATDWLETNYTHDSFFLWIDMWDPHEPFDCPWYDYCLYGRSGYRGDRMLYPEYGRPTYMSDEELRDARARYAGNCTLVDRWIGRLLETVEKLGLMKNTLIVWTSDHGHLFGDHDLQGKPGAELGNLYETTARIPLFVRHPEGVGAGARVPAIVQPADVLPSICEFLEVPIPSRVQGRSFWPLVEAGSGGRKAAFSSRFPPTAGDASYHPVEGAVFDGWKGSDRKVEASTVTTEEWALLCAPLSRPSELYHLPSDPLQQKNVIAENSGVADGLRKDWIDFLETHGASPARIDPFRKEGEEPRISPEGRLFAFRDDLGRWIAFPTESEARQRAYRKDAPGKHRKIREIRLADLRENDPRNLVHMAGQYYWAEDLCGG